VKTPVSLVRWPIAHVCALHDGDVVEHLRKPRHVLRGVAIGIRPWEERGRRRKVELLARGRTTELLEEREEVGGVLGRDVVAADALRRWIFPTVLHQDH
jgi:hypothetical protein